MKKILVVDDDEDILETVTAILALHNYEVVTHNTGFNVPAVVKKSKPDLLLLDIRLPGKQGTEICKELKAISKLPPVLLFSAHANEKESLHTCHADGFISKPFDLNNFLETIERYVA